MSAWWVLTAGAGWLWMLVLIARVFFALGREAERQDAIVAAAVNCLADAIQAQEKK